MVDGSSISGRVIRSEFIEAVHAGMRSASRTFEKWSGGWPIISLGVEHMISTYIAMSMFDRFGDRGYMITPETPFGMIEEWTTAEARRGRTRAILSPQHRADVVIWNARNRPIGVVEVKRHWTRGRCLHDIDRLDALLDRYGSQTGGTIQFGLLAVMLGCEPDGTPRDPDDQRLAITQQIKDHIANTYPWSDHPAPRRHRVGDTNDPYLMSSLVIELKGRRA